MSVTIDVAVAILEVYLRDNQLCMQIKRAKSTVLAHQGNTTIGGLCGMTRSEGIVTCL